MSEMQIERDGGANKSCYVVTQGCDEKSCDNQPGTFVHQRTRVCEY